SSGSHQRSALPTHSTVFEKSFPRPRPAERIFCRGAAKFGWFRATRAKEIGERSRLSDVRRRWLFEKLWTGGGRGRSDASVRRQSREETARPISQNAPKCTIAGNRLNCARLLRLKQK